MQKYLITKEEFIKKNLMNYQRNLKETYFSGDDLRSMT